jgi:signal transduction histidine kinase
MTAALPGGRILLAADNPKMRAYIQGLLDRHWNVEAATGGVEALAAVRARPPDLVLTDAMMASKNALALLRELRSDSSTRELPVVMFSALPSEEMSVEAFEEGVDDYLIEPFTARELVARVAGAIKLSHMRAEVAQARAEAQVASARESLVKVAAHELRTPLTVIGGYVSLLLDGSLPGDSQRARTALELVGRKTEEAKQLVNQMLLAARIDAGGVILRMSTLDLRRPVTEAVKGAVGLAELESGELIMTLPEQPVMVDGDWAHLSLILNNLISNALVHGRGGGIEIVVSDTPPTVKVVDHGPGVPAEARTRIFEPFFQVDGQLHGRGGVGLGLAVSRQLAALQGGSLVLEDPAPGVGASFALTLPGSVAPQG